MLAQHQVDDDSFATENNSCAMSSSSNMSQIYPCLDITVFSIFQPTLYIILLARSESTENMVEFSSDNVQIMFIVIYSNVNKCLHPFIPALPSP